MANLTAIYKVTKTQYNTLKSGGTVGTYTWDDNALYIIDKNEEYVPNTTTINGKQLNNNIVLTSNDISYNGETDWDISTAIKHHIINLIHNTGTTSGSGTLSHVDMVMLNNYPSLVSIDYNIGAGPTVRLNYSGDMSSAPYIYNGIDSSNTLYTAVINADGSYTISPTSLGGNSSSGTQLYRHSFIINASDGSGLQGHMFIYSTQTYTWDYTNVNGTINQLVSMMQLGARQIVGAYFVTAPLNGKGAMPITYWSAEGSDSQATIDMEIGGGNGTKNGVTGTIRSGDIGPISVSAI